MVAEAKIVGFWPYREGALQVADAFDMTLTEVAATYLRALAAWASDDIPLAACHPDGPPPCVAEDMAVLAARIEQHADVPPRRRAARLAELAHTIISHVLADASIAPLRRLQRRPRRGAPAAHRAGLHRRPGYLVGGRAVRPDDAPGRR